MTLRLVHLAARHPHPEIWTPAFRAALEQFGPLRVIADCARRPDEERAALAREANVALTDWGAAPLPATLADDPGALQFVCHLTGTLRGIVPEELVAAGLPVTNWGDTPALPIAEAALTLLLACLKNLRSHIERAPNPDATAGSLRDLRVGVFGLGQIGQKFVELLRPFGSRILAYDPFATAWPENVTRVKSLAALFANSDAVAIHAALTEKTRRSVTAELLCLLPDQGIVINTARGDIVDQDALFAELACGRLRAGLDVLAAPDRLPDGHPAFSWPNLILTHHAAGRNPWPATFGDDGKTLRKLHCVALENLHAFATGAPLRHRITPEVFRRST